MGNETIRARQGIYSEKFDYKAEQSANHCNELIPQSQCPALHTNKEAHPLIKLSRCAQCRHILYAFCINKLGQKRDKEHPGQVIRSGVETLAEHPLTADEIGALQKKVSMIYKYKDQSVQTVKQNGIQH